MTRNEPTSTKPGPGAGSITPISQHGWITGQRAVASPAIRRLNQLLERPDTVQQLSPLALHRLTSELGLADSMPLLEVAEPEQVRALLDLEVWRHSRVDLANLLDWTAALAQLDPERAAAHLYKLDVELLSFLLRRETKVYFARTDEVPEEPEGVFYTTPDGVFALDLLGESEGQNDKVVAIVEALYVDDPEMARRLLTNVMWEVPTELEEESLRWRNARMEDLGFADPTEALKVYAFLDPSSVQADEMSANTALTADPEPTAAGDLTELLPASDSFWSEAIRRIEDTDTRERLAIQLTTLANLTLSADRVDPSDREHGQEALDRLRGRLSLGLEQLSEGDPARAAAVLRCVALTRLARLGHSLVLQRQRRLLPWIRANRLGRRPRGLDLLDSPLRERLQSMMSHPPHFMQEDGATRPFETRNDLQAIDNLVEAAVAAAELTPKAIWPEPLPVGRHLSAIFVTELLNRVLGRSGAFDREAVVAAMDWIDGGQPTEAIQLEADALAQSLLARSPAPHERTLYQSWIGAASASLGRLDPATFDPRFIDCLVTSED
jgi:hypothetical protein